MAVLCGSRKHAQQMAARLRENGVPHRWLNTGPAKRNYDPGAQLVSILSIQSSKGLEFKSVIVIGAGHLDARGVSEAAQAKLLYVAMTRARERLLITASAENVCTEKLAALAALAA